MQKEIHPNVNLINVKCSCGNIFEVESTIHKDFDVEICSKCHPFYTGSTKIVDSGGRVKRFKDKFGDL